MSKTFYDKGNDLLKSLKIQTKIIKDNKDIQESRNFSAVLPQKSTRILVK